MAETCHMAKKVNGEGLLTMGNIDCFSISPGQYCCVLHTSCVLLSPCSHLL